MLCRLCSIEVGDNHRYCPMCGSPLAGAPARTATPGHGTPAARPYVGAHLGEKKTDEVDDVSDTAGVEESQDEVPSVKEPVRLSPSETRMAFRTRIRAAMVSGVVGLDERQNLHDEGDAFGLETGDVDELIRDMEGIMEIRRFEGHHGGVASAVFLPDGHWVLSTGFDTSVCLWDVTTGREVRRLDIQGQASIVLALAISPDGRRALSAAADAVLLWELATGRLIRRFQANAERVMSVAFSSDGRRVFSACSHCIRVWDLETGRELLRFQYCEEGDLANAPRSIAFAPSGALAVCGTASGTIRILDFEHKREIRRFEEKYTSSVYSVAISFDERRGLSGDKDGFVTLWDAGDGCEIRRIPAHIGPVPAVAFSPDGRSLLSGGEDETIRLWELPPDL